MISFYRESISQYKADVWIKRSKGSSFGGWEKWHDHFCILEQDCQVADINGDRKDDLIAFVKSNGEVWASLSTGNGFGPATRVLTNFCRGGHKCAVGDVNSDRKADLIAIHNGWSANGISPGGNDRDDIRVSRYEGSRTSPRFGTPYVHNTAMCAKPLNFGQDKANYHSTCLVGDWNDDRVVDLMQFNNYTGSNALQNMTGDKVNMSLTDYDSKRRGFFSTTRIPVLSYELQSPMCLDENDCIVGDFNGDGADDIAKLARNERYGFVSGVKYNRGDVITALSNMNVFGWLMPPPFK